MSWISKLLAALFPKPKPSAPTCGVAVVVKAGSNSGAPVVGAKVALTWIGGGAIGPSNADGYVAFTNVPKAPTEVTVIVSATGFVSYSGPYTFGAANQDVPVALQSSIPIAPEAPREYCGNMCGVRIANLPNVAGGKDPTLVLSWFYDRYDADGRKRVRDAWKARGYLDVLLSWPDSRDFGQSPDQFVGTCRELVADGFRPCVMLLSKYYDPADDFAGCMAHVDQILDKLLEPRCVSRIGIAWEQSLFLSPQIVQQLVDTIAPRCVAAGVKCYTHDRGGYAKYPENATPEISFGEYWRRQVGKLTGILYQWNLDWHPDDLQPRLTDILERFAGGYGCPADSGFGHPFDLIALEITAMRQYDGQMSEADGDTWGTKAIETPAVNGVRVQGSGNGRR